MNHEVDFEIPDGNDGISNVEVIDSDKVGNDKTRGKHVFQFITHKNADRAFKRSRPILELDQYTLDVAKRSHDWFSDIQRPVLQNNF